MEPKQPIRCFEGSAKPHEPFWRWSNATEQGAAGETGVAAEPELEFYGYISEYSWFDDDITPKKFKTDLYRFGNGGPITIRMNSGGGDMIAASVIRSTLIDYPGRKTVRIDGLAASAATVVALAGNVIRMQDTSFFMIHDPMVIFFLAALNIEDLSRLLEELKSAKGGLVDVYEARTGISRDRLAKMMVNETWMNAREAVDLGFADEVIIVPNGQTHGSAPTDSAQQTAMVNAIKNYRNVPAALAALARVGDAPQPVQNNQQAAKLRAESRLLCKKRSTE
jgi:ATP-dependent Clp protease protease subunit